MKKPRVLITVEGGVVQDIATDVPVEVLLYDWDNIKDNPGWRATQPATVIGKAAFDKLLKQQELLVDEAHSVL